MARIGILGGTFDPPHIGHLILAELAADHFALSKLLFVPAADPPHKLQEPKTATLHRVEMARLAIADNSRFLMSSVDTERPGPHYSVDMVRILRDSYPQDDLYFIMGSDSFADLPNWHRPQDLMQMCTIGVMQRPGDPVTADMHEAILPGLASRTHLIDAPLLQISSTWIAQRIGQNQSVRYLVADAVLQYIIRNELYSRRSE